MQGALKCSSIIHLMFILSLLDLRSSSFIISVVDLALPSSLARRVVEIRFNPLTMKTLFAVGLACLAVMPLIADESESEVIPWVRLPEACQAAVRQLGEDIQLVRIEAKQEYGIQVYDVRMLRAGEPMKVELTAEGRFLEFEESVSPSQLPQKVLEVMQRSATGKTEVRATAVILYAYKIEYEDGRPAVLLDAAGKTPVFEQD